MQQAGAGRRLPRRTVILKRVWTCGLRVGLTVAQGGRGRLPAVYSSQDRRQKTCTVAPHGGRAKKSWKDGKWEKGPSAADKRNLARDSGERLPYHAEDRQADRPASGQVRIVQPLAYFSQENTFAIAHALATVESSQFPYSYIRQALKAGVVSDRPKVRWFSVTFSHHLKLCIRLWTVL